MKTELKSCLWVLSAYDNPGSPAYQVDVLDTAETMAEVQELGGLTRTRCGLNITQAVAAGFDLTVIAENLNVDALIAREATQAALDAAQARIHVLVDEIATLKAAKT